MLIESPKPPTDAEIERAGGAGLYCVEGVKNISTALPLEYSLALDSLAFTCTYGKKNCLTNDMYSSNAGGGPPTLGKITGLVWGKVREGVFRC